MIRSLVIVVVAAFAAAPALAESVGFHIKFAGKSTSLTCADIWETLKVEGRPDLQSLGGSVISASETPCKGYKNIAGSKVAADQVLADLSPLNAFYDIQIWELGATEVTANTTDLSEQFNAKFVGNFANIDEYLTFIDTFRDADARELPEIFVNTFKNPEFAEKLKIHFATGQCLQNFSINYRWYAYDRIDGKIKLAMKRIVRPEICQ